MKVKETGTKSKKKTNIWKITTKQYTTIKRLIPKNCANYDHRNCICLDDGDTHICAQLNKKSGIGCYYLLESVLPSFKELYSEIVESNNVSPQEEDIKTKVCLDCKAEFVPKSNNQKYCSDCGEIHKRKNATNRQRKKRAK